MTRRAPRATLNAIVVALVTLVLGGGVARRCREARPLIRMKPGTGEKHAAKRHVENRVSRALRAVQIANHLTGIPYRWGGSSPRAGFDCSGCMQYVYAKVGIHLPHYAAGRSGQGRRVSRGSLRAGDLVFFSGLGHVGIYAGDGKFIHAPRSGATVRWSRLSSHGSYYGATRLFAA